MQVTNEMEVIAFFAQKIVNVPHIEIVSLTGSAFPDAVISWNGVEYRVEFEYQASSFWAHGHNPIDCDFVICWENDDPFNVLPIVSLQSEGWENYELSLISRVKKTASYWKRRALIAEGKLPEIVKVEITNIDEIEAAKKTADSLAEFVQMVKCGESRNAASKAAFGKPYAGNSHVDRCQDALLSEGIC